MSFNSIKQRNKLFFAFMSAKSLIEYSENCIDLICSLDDATSYEVIVDSNQGQAIMVFPYKDLMAIPIMSSCWATFPISHSTEEFGTNLKDDATGIEYFYPYVDDDYNFKTLEEVKQLVEE